MTTPNGVLEAIRSPATGMAEAAALAPSPGRPLRNSRGGGAGSIPSRCRRSFPLQGVQTGDIIYTCSETWFTHLDMKWRTGMCRLRSDE